MKDVDLDEAQKEVPGQAFCPCHRSYRTRSKGSRRHEAFRLLSDVRASTSRSHASCSSFSRISGRVAHYSPIWRYNYVIVPRDYEPNSLKSEEDCLSAGLPIIESDVYTN